ncbi:hypothetical protein [Hasllibacter sp. MH4015]|uniref:hypothetical protein n=1 Tax=Hasllibacter sp. MH4015 TaxID=2854029 RepID=UPI001CD4CF7B|nr:hypothetical protein [Hasllibacter sp. MH4015]
MTVAGWITIGLVTITVLGVVAIIRHHTSPHRTRTPRGTEPGHGDTLVYAKERTAFFGSGNEDAAGRVVRVTRDPQHYARAMMPGNRK